jgi:hypothetical protein
MQWSIFANMRGNGTILNRLGHLPAPGAISEVDDHGRNSSNIYQAPNLHSMDVSDNQGLLYGHGFGHYDQL